MRSTHRRGWRASIAAAIAATCVAVAVQPAVAWNDPNDPEWKVQYGPVQIGAPDAWAKSTGAGVIVAVIDSGVDVDHPDLKPKLVAGRDFADGDDNPDDDSPLQDGEGKYVLGHGTGGAGVIGAVTNNGVGIAAVAPDVKIMPLKVFPSSENESLLSLASSVPAAIRYAVDNGAKVINLSLGTFSFGFLGGFIETPCQDAYSRGALCVVSSGNHRKDQPESGYARNLQGLLVAATNDQGKATDFAQNADTQWSLTAPGQRIRTTATVEQGGYQTVDGTSFSAPHASGVAALLFAQGLPVDQVVRRMLDTATSIGEPNRNGAGIVNATAAVGATTTEPPNSPSASVLLPNAVGRTTVPPRSATTAPDQGDGEGGATATTESTLPPEDDPDDFAADLAGAETTGAVDEFAGNRPDDVENLKLYSLGSVVFLVLAIVGVGLWSRSRGRTAA